MTEVEKKQRGDIYDARDSEIRRQYSRGKDWAKNYNSLPANDAHTKDMLLRLFLGRVGKNVRVNQPLSVDYGYNISVGNNCFINMNCTLLDACPISIGDNTLLGPDVKIYTSQHPLNGAERFWENPDGTIAVKTWTAPVKSGSYAWIGGDTIILPGVSIGDNVVVSAGSAVTESIPDNAIACGNPCKIKKWNLPIVAKKQD